MLLARLPSGQWSAPCFLVSRALSLGMTFGFKELHHCRVLATATAVEAFKVGWAAGAPGPL
jgi:lipid-binding SYLF domain-containing protein